MRRGALRRFHRLQQAAAELPVDVIWDRRTPDQTAVNRRSRITPTLAERRQQPSFTWTAADFVLVEEDDTH